MRSYLLSHLLSASSRLERLGRSDPAWSRLYGLDRIEKLRLGLPVCVTGYEVVGAMSADDRIRIDLSGHYVLHEDGRLSGAYEDCHA